MFKNKLKNYFLIDFVKSYIFVLTTLSLLLWVTSAAKFLYLVTDTGLSIYSYAQYIAYQLPKVTSQVILISYPISIFLVLIKFQNNKEIEIYWLSGISKIEISKLILKLSLILSLISMLLFVFLAPYTSYLSRSVIANSEFSLINSLVKKNNFNSPVKDLTIYVHKNDNQGNLEKIYIFENDKTIISKRGRVLNIDDKRYLELLNGVIHQKDGGGNITTINFEKTMYDFTKYKSDVVTTPKLQERSFSSILKEHEKTKNKNILYEIHKRIFKPLFVPVIGILCCFILFTNNEKINLNKLKVTIFISSILFIIFIEILINISTLGEFYKYSLYTFPFLSSFILFLLLKKFLKNESIT